MKTSSAVSVLVLALFCLTLSSTAQAEERVAGVHILHPGENLEAKRKALGLGSYTDVSSDTSGEAFLLISDKAGVMYEVFALDFNEADGQLHLGRLLEGFSAHGKKGGIILRHHVPEGVPNLAVCFRGEDRLRQCWIPRFSGLDGSLVLDEGFYPVREPGEKANKKKYSRESGTRLPPAELIDQPYVMMEQLHGKDQLARMAAEYRFVPKGEFRADRTHNFLFVPLVLPVTLSLYVMDYSGGDGTLRPAPEVEMRLTDNEVAVFSLNLDAFAGKSSEHFEESAYVFQVRIDGNENTHFWFPHKDRDSGAWEGYGFGAFGKFIRWPSGAKG